jgi:hypothetical protein
MLRTGLLEYAATNDIVVVFPQIDNAYDQYCWDFKGVTNKDLFTKKGLQPQAIYAMIKDLKK